MTTGEAHLEVTRHSGVVRVRLARPEVKNALGGATFDQLRRTIAEIGRNDDDRVVVIEGSGGVFCAGGELPRRAPDQAPPPPTPMSTGLKVMQQLVGDAMLALHRCPKPVIAAVDGPAIGAGFSLALACDLVLASDRARFALPFVTLGMALDAGISWTLPRAVGLNVAKELAFFGDSLTAEDAAGLGLVNRVVPADQLDSVVTTWSERLAQSSPTALAMIKQALNRSHHTSFSDALAAEGLAQVISVRSGEV